MSEAMSWRRHVDAAYSGLRHDDIIGRSIVARNTYGMSFRHY